MRCTGTLLVYSLGLKFRWWDDDDDVVVVVFVVVDDDDGDSVYYGDDDRAGVAPTLSECSDVFSTQGFFGRICIGDGLQAFPRAIC